MPTFSFIYSIPYIVLFLLLYANVLPLYKAKTTSSFNYGYSIFTQHFFIIILLFIFIGLRGFVSTDWQSYHPIYYSTPSLFDGMKSISSFLTWPFENGFLFYMILCKTISSNYFFFQFISFTIDFFVLYYFFKRTIPKFIILGFTFFILFSGIVMEFNLLRNSKAIMLFLISLKYVEKKSFTKYAILNIIGALFHITSLLYLPLYFVLDKRYSRTIIISLFIVGNLVFLSQLEWCRSIISSISPLIPGRMGFIINAYLSSDFYSGAYGISIGYLERFFSFVVFYCFSRKLYSINKNNLIYINAFYLYAFLFLYYSEVAIILGRVTILLIFSYWILYPQVYSLLLKKSRKIFLLFLFIYGILKLGLGCSDIYFLYDNALLPYKSYQERLNISNQHSKYIYER